MPGSEVLAGNEMGRVAPRFGTCVALPGELLILSCHIAKVPRWRSVAQSASAMGAENRSNYG